jgi:hypothetical protein
MARTIFPAATIGTHAARHVWPEVACVSVSAIALACGLAWVEGAPPMRGDQQHLNLIVEQQLDPSFLPPDALYAPSVLR